MTNEEFLRKFDAHEEFSEEEIKEIFITAFNKLLTEKKEIIANVELMRRTLFDTAELTEERDKAAEEMAILVEMTQSCISENARVAQNQEEYQKHYSELVKRYDKAKEKHDELNYKIEQKKAQSEKMKLFIKALKEQDSIVTEFDDALWGSLVDFITIGKKERTVIFKDGTVIDV